MPWWGKIALGIVLVLSTGLLVACGFVIYNISRSGISDRAIARLSAEGQLILGGATVLLTTTIAAGTIWYARLTHDLVAHADLTRNDVREQLNLGREQLAASRDQISAALSQVSLGQRSMSLAVRPLIADVGPVWPGEDRATVELIGYGLPYVIDDPARVSAPRPNERYAYLVVPIRNIGAGPAVLVAAQLLRTHGDPSGAAVAGATLQNVLPVGEVTHAVFAVPRDKTLGIGLYDEVANRSPLNVRILYRSISGSNDIASVLELRSDHEHDGLRVARVAFENVDG